ncbi:acetyl-CoA carboxylase-like [Sycon ciliatum]|uniref:acetyl-CoA carboxylase-like n=1 Tax=Sycon ciliatum TaxID=27933 RepID=UPI0031F62175
MTAKEGIIHAASPAELVQKFGGDRVVDRVLIANNGIAAVKCMRSLRRWAYEIFGNDHAIFFVSMVTPEDLKANAEYIKMADQYVMVPGGSNNHNYANVEVIVDVALRTNVQAVWAGWGHASEYPRLPESLLEHDIAFIGPPAQAMRALGDKIASSIVAQTANVPTLPWNGLDLTIPGVDSLPAGTIVTVPQDLYEKGCVEDAASGSEAALRIGYPVMIKASEGGGGKGIRRCDTDADFPMMFRQVQLEVPGSPIFIMKLATNVRHLEVQLLADKYGNAISLFGRDCSIQRRHQKIIEEAPAGIADPDVFVEMEKAAVRLAKMVGYVSAGTVEYLYSADGGFHFLELNPRLQVEHPCTEMVADVNLPACQLQVAMGLPLNRIKDIRILYGQSPWDNTEIDFDNPVPRPVCHGHVIAARITSENPDEGFKPSGGNVTELNFRSNKNVWGYFSVAASGGLHEFADSQFGHIFAWGEDREEARENMVVALRDLSIRGDFHTTVEYLVMLMETENFLNNTFHTGWLDQLIATKARVEKPDPLSGVVCCALHVAHNDINGSVQEYKSSIERGLSPTPESLVSMIDVELINDNVKYIMKVTRSSQSSYFLLMNESSLEVEVHRMTDGGLLLSTGSNSFTTYMIDEVDRYRVVVNGKAVVFEKERDPTKLRSPSTGKLLTFVVADGGHVNADDPYAEIEVMKMVMTLRVSEAGKVVQMKRPGAVLDAGMIIAQLELDDPGAVKQLTLYKGPLPYMLFTASSPSRRPLQKFQAAIKKLNDILDGYCIPEPYLSQIVQLHVENLMESLYCPELPLLDMQDALSSLENRLPARLLSDIRALLQAYSRHESAPFPFDKIASLIDNHTLAIKKHSERERFIIDTQTIVELLKRYRGGARGHQMDIVVQFLRRYMDVEEKFAIGSFDKCLDKLRENNRDQMEKVVQYVLAHHNVTSRNVLILALLECISQYKMTVTGDLQDVLTSLAELSSPGTTRVALIARTTLISSMQTPYEEVYRRVEMSLAQADFSQSNGQVKTLVESTSSIFNVLVECLFSENARVASNALEVYVRRSYLAYKLTSLSVQTAKNGTPMAEFKFMLPASHPNIVKRSRGSLASIYRSDSIDENSAVTFRLSDVRTSDSRTSLTSRNSQEKIHSFGDGTSVDGGAVHVSRIGVMVAFLTLESLAESFNSVMDTFANHQSAPTGSATLSIGLRRARMSLQSFAGYSLADHTTSTSSEGDEAEPCHIVNIALLHSPVSAGSDDNTTLKVLQDFLAPKKSVLRNHGIRRVTFIVHQDTRLPKYFTFRSSEDFGEDSIYRHLEPGLAFQLELKRLMNFNIELISTPFHHMHLYFGAAKVPAGQKVTDHRFFVRFIVRDSDFNGDMHASYDYMETQGERLLLEALDELEVAMGNKKFPKTDCNHIFFNFVPPILVDVDKLEAQLRGLVAHHSRRLLLLRVTECEMKLTMKLTTHGKNIPVRVFITNDSGYFVNMDMYREEEDPQSAGLIFRSFNRKHGEGPLNGLPTIKPYETKDLLQSRRYAAQTMNTTYVYDFLNLFYQAVRTHWREHAEKGHCSPSDIPIKLLESKELVLNEQGQLQELTRAPGSSTVGMVAWRLTLFTPECPEGRDVILISNDITHQIGSFGPDEDMLFNEASLLARSLGLPRLYIASNSGARIGLADEVKRMFQVAWVNPDKPDEGFKYLYVTPADYKKICNESSINAKLIEDEGQSRYMILDIYGRQHGLGVENLRGSGMIAGESSQAYDEIFTLSLVTCRTIGIGAYLVRLGQRVIQVDSSHIILTGAAALNKVLGRNVYSSNAQLGGTQIMHQNGVSHLTVSNDFDGVVAMVKWLSYVPKSRSSPLPALPVSDPIHRHIEFVPTKAPYDPRFMLAGRTKTDSGWESGFFDRGSFCETLKPWAQTVVCGRARLGGLPVGVIAVETRSVELTEPADPANPDSETKTVSQAGQVWYPDSAFKTAQAIRDFDREGLPLFIFANWRGFSGGMRDMFEEVLKFGALIVDALRVYHQPCFVYIPPRGELRGGAWVVLDPTINPDAMEMYADNESRGGVLEPEGIVSIKFRAGDIQKCMHRLDPLCVQLSAGLKAKDLSAEEKDTLTKKLAQREQSISPMYQQIAVKFADLHDTAGRMLEKNVIHRALDWRSSRTFFFFRLRRRLEEFDFWRHLESKDKTYTQQKSITLLHRWFLEEFGEAKAHLWANNEFVANWMQKQMADSNSILRQKLRRVERDAISEQVSSIVEQNSGMALELALKVVEHLSPTQVSRLSQILGPQSVEGRRSKTLLHQAAGSSPLPTPDL